MRRRGLTLIKLLVILAIIGVLVTMILLANFAVREAATREAEHKQLVEDAQTTTVTLVGVLTDILTDIGTQHDPFSGLNPPTYKFKTDGQDQEEILANFDDEEIVGKTHAEVSTISSSLHKDKRYALSVYGHPNPHRNIRAAFEIPEEKSDETEK